MSRTPEQMLADRLRRVNRPDGQEHREQLARELEQFEECLKALDGYRGEWPAEVREEWFRLARAARTAIHGRSFEDPGRPDPGCGWNSVDAVPFCDWDPGCLVHGGKGDSDGP